MTDAGACFDRSATMKQPAKGLCRGCGQPVPKGRMTWCSKACVDAALIKLSPSVARSRVWQRDCGVCAKCGFDTAQAERIVGWLRMGGSAVKARTSIDADWRAAVALALNLWAPRKKPHESAEIHWVTPHLWEADHIRPVVEGGGACELENYRTLCIPCHRAETKALAERRAKARKDAKYQERLAKWSGNENC